MNGYVERRFNQLRGDTKDLSFVFEYVQRLESAIRGLCPSNQADEIIDHHVEAARQYASREADDITEY